MQGLSDIPSPNGVLATMRIARLITEDKITEPVRDFVEGRFPDSKLSYLITCYLCTSVYAAAAVTAMSSSPRLRPVVRALAASEAAILLREHGG